MKHLDHLPSCACGGSGSTVDRRWLLRGGAAAAVMLTATPLPALAVGGNYEAMILACIDPRLQDPVHAYAAKRNLIGKYSQFVIAGAAIGVVSPKFADWHKTFWDNLAVTIQLHQIKRVIAIDHRDCGAAAIAYGQDAVATPTKETETHREALARFRKEVGERQPTIGVEMILMALDGSVVVFG